MTWQEFTETMFAQSDVCLSLHHRYLYKDTGIHIRIHIYIYVFINFQLMTDNSLPVIPSQCPWHRHSLDPTPLHYLLMWMLSYLATWFKGHPCLCPSYPSKLLYLIYGTFFNSLFLQIIYSALALSLSSALLLLPNLIVLVTHRLTSLRKRPAGHFTTSCLCYQCSPTHRMTYLIVMVCVPLIT